MKYKLPKVQITDGKHRGKSVIFITFYFNSALIGLAKSIRCSWSNTRKKWYLPYSEKNKELLIKTFKNHANIDLSALKKLPVKGDPEQKTILPEDLNEGYREKLYLFEKYLRGKALSESTVRTYSTHILGFLYFLKDKPVVQINNRDIERFIEDVCVPRRYSISTHRQIFGAMKHFKQLFNNCEIDETLIRMPKKSNYLPTVLSEAEVLELLRVTRNLKHRAILAMIYASGLRVGELIKLELRDIDFRRSQIFVRNGKGRKDRYVMLAKSMVPLLNNYLNTYRPLTYFVEGTEAGTPYTAGSIRNFLRKSCRAAGIKKRVTPHTLRHSYATHLLENGVDIRYIQELLGHTKPETTMIYTHVASKDLVAIESPLDKIAKDILNKAAKSDEKLTLSGMNNL